MVSPWVDFLSRQYVLACQCLEYRQASDNLTFPNREDAIKIRPSLDTSGKTCKHYTFIPEYIGMQVQVTDSLKFNIVSNCKITQKSCNTRNWYLVAICGQRGTNAMKCSVTWVLRSVIPISFLLKRETGNRKVQSGYRCKRMLRRKTNARSRIGPAKHLYGSSSRSITIHLF